MDSIFDPFGSRQHGVAANTWPIPCIHHVLYLYVLGHDPPIHKRTVVSLFTLYPPPPPTLLFSLPSPQKDGVYIACIFPILSGVETEKKSNLPLPFCYQCKRYVPRILKSNLKFLGQYIISSIRFIRLSTIKDKRVGTNSHLRCFPTHATQTPNDKCPFPVPHPLTMFSPCNKYK